MKTKYADSIGIALNALGLKNKVVCSGLAIGQRSGGARRAITE
jgi:hypothetical protein